VDERLTQEILRTALQPHLGQLSVDLLEALPVLLFAIHFHRLIFRHLQVIESAFRSLDFEAVEQLGCGAGDERVLSTLKDLNALPKLGFLEQTPLCDRGIFDMV